MTARSRRYSVPGRDHRTHVRFTADEYAELAAAVARAGLTPKRSASVAEVLRNLFGPGEHRDPRVVAAWAFATTSGVDELQPVIENSYRLFAIRRTGPEHWAFLSRPRRAPATSAPD